MMAGSKRGSQLEKNVLAKYLDEKSCTLFSINANKEKEKNILTRDFVFVFNSDGRQKYVDKNVPITEMAQKNQFEIALESVVYSMKYFFSS